jgi:predicted acetyltransferase
VLADKPAGRFAGAPPPGYNRWMWDGELCGTINFRRRPGTSTLPDYVLGHIGYAVVVPWKRGQGYARAALLALLPEIRERGLTYVELTTVLSASHSRLRQSIGGSFLQAGNVRWKEVRYRIDL